MKNVVQDISVPETLITRKDIEAVGSIVFRVGMTALGLLAN